MIAYRHSLIGTLALTLLLTVGSGSSFAQNKFRGLGNVGSSNNGGMNKGTSRFNLGTGSNFNKNNSSLGSNFKNSGGNNLNAISGGLNTNQKTLGGFNFNNGKQSTLNSHGLKGSKLLNGSNGINGSNQGSNSDKKFNGLQNVLNGPKGQGNNLQHLGQGNNGGHGNASKLLQLIQHNQKHNKVCVGHKDWCHTKPQTCHWWYNYCKPLAYCEPQHHHHCSWHYVTCDYSVNGHVLHQDARWFLGLKGLLLPGQGVGVEEVAPGSPAAAVGLQPGMVITRCNGIDMIDEAALGQAIAQSGGALQMDLLLAEGTPATCVVVMQRVTSVNF
jgi:hypothetical protein